MILKPRNQKSIYTSAKQPTIDNCGNIAKFSHYEVVFSLQYQNTEHKNPRFLLCWLFSTDFSVYFGSYRHRDKQLGGEVCK